MKRGLFWLAAAVIIGCSAQQVQTDGDAAVVLPREEALDLRQEDELHVAVRRALSLEGLDNVTVEIAGDRVELGGWVFSPEDKVLAHDVAQSVYGVSDVEFVGIRVG